MKDFSDIKGTVQFLNLRQGPLPTASFPGFVQADGLLGYYSAHGNK